MVDLTLEMTDPRIRRTRQLLRQSLETLLKNKAFDEISVQDIADAATVNRVTFYDHYPDKFALLQCVVGSRFEEYLRERRISFNGACSSGLKATFLSVCDYLSSTPWIFSKASASRNPAPLNKRGTTADVGAGREPGALRSSPDDERRMEPYLESAIIAVIKEVILDGFRKHTPRAPMPLEISANTLSWAIYGAAQEWARSPDRPPSEEIAETIVSLLFPVLDMMYREDPHGQTNINADSLGA